MTTQANRLSRRDWLRLSAAGFTGVSLSGWLEQLAHGCSGNPSRKRACILLWMSGGPSQMDTFDLKPGHENGGPFKEIPTSVPGIRISEHLPKVAQQMEHLSLIRSMQTKEADHARATYAMRTGRSPMGSVHYPTLGSLFAKELENQENALPSFVSIAPYRFLSPGAFDAGFLGPEYAPLIVGEQNNIGVFGNQQQQQDGYQLRVADLDLPQGIDQQRARRRLKHLNQSQKEFLQSHQGRSGLSHQIAYQRAVAMMRSTAVQAFNLEEEPAALRDAYGRNVFGQGCLLARRLVERGVPFVEVSLSQAGQQLVLGWDTHTGNFPGVERLSNVLDPAWATLITDLKTRGLLETTTIVWMGEFGRTPRINQTQGRDHWAKSWTTVLGGGGIKGGQVVGSTNDDGTEVVDRPVSVEDFLATVFQATGIDPTKENMSNMGRPIRIMEAEAEPVREVLL